MSPSRTPGHGDYQTNQKQIPRFARNDTSVELTERSLILVAAQGSGIS